MIADDRNCDIIYNVDKGKNCGSKAAKKCGMGKGEMKWSELNCLKGRDWGNQLFLYVTTRCIAMKQESIAPAVFTSWMDFGVKAEKDFAGTLL